MTYQEAILTLVEKILTDDLEEAVSVCSEFPELTRDDENELRAQLMDLLGDENILAGQDVIGIIDALALDKTDALKAVIDMRRNFENYSTAEKIKASNAYALINSANTQYYNDLEKDVLVRSLSSMTINTRDVALVREMLAKVKEFGI